MPKPLPRHPNVRNCTHIKVTGQRCGSPALRREFFCYFHTRVIKGVQQRVDMRLDSMALLEDCESIQLSIMHVVDGLVKGTLDPTRARLIIQALRIAARNAKNVRFDAHHHGVMAQPIVREVPDYARQYLIEHPEFGPPLSPCSDEVPAREAAQSPCSADIPVREARTTTATQCEVQATPAAQPEAPASPAVSQQTASAASVAAEPAAQRRKNAAHGASRGTATENDTAPKERKNPRELREEENELKRAQAAIAGAERGNWRDLRTVFEFAGIGTQNKDAPS
jgi:hypothetical protein